MARMAEQGIFDRWAARGANAATFWTLFPSGIIGVIAAVLSRGVTGIDAYGPFGWLIAGLVAFALAALGFFLAGLAYERFAVAKARRKWTRQVDAINPLEDEFCRQRVRVLDLAHPVQPLVSLARVAGLAVAAVTEHQ